MRLIYALPEQAWAVLLITHSRQHIEGQPGPTSAIHLVHTQPACDVTNTFNL